MGVHVYMTSPSLFWPGQKLLLPCSQIWYLFLLCCMEPTIDKCPLLNISASAAAHVFLLHPVSYILFFAVWLLLHFIASFSVYVPLCVSQWQLLHLCP
jgi:hypothetical protein